MIFLASYTYIQSSPRGGQSYSATENVVITAEKDEDVKEAIEKFLTDDKCGYRKHIKLTDLKRVS